MKYERVKEQLAMMLKIMTGFLSIGENFEGRTRGFSEGHESILKRTPVSKTSLYINSSFSLPLSLAQFFKQ